jgi:hypothetical protein
MSAVKVSVSLDQEQLRWLKRQARKHKTTVSALMGEAVADLRRRRALDRLLGDVELTREDIAEIHAEWHAD